jgi:circadian clock protein KaiC
VNTDERSSSGLAALDGILDGGFVRQRIHLIEGAPGTGKTTLGLQFLLAGRDAGEKGLYVTLSESRDELAAVARAHKWPLDGIDIFELTPDTDPRGATSQTMFHPSEVELSETTQLLFAEIERIGPSRLVLDSLSELRLLAQSPLRYRRQILALKQHLTGQRITVLMLDDMTSEMHDLQLHSIAHGVLTLEQIAIEYGAERRRLPRCAACGFAAATTTTPFAPAGSKSSPGWSQAIRRAGAGRRRPCKAFRRSWIKCSAAAYSAAPARC